MKIAIIKYNAGNIQSVLNALDRIGHRGVLTDKPEEILTADRVIFPGVGEASTAMQYLKTRKLDVLIKSLSQPVLGICLGMQLLGVHTEENNTSCLGIVPAKVRKITQPTAATARLKVPHVGWNTASHQGTGLFVGVRSEPYFYFVHSFAMEPGSFTTAQTNYGIPFSSAVQWKNFSGVQFHPEKSAGAGEQLLNNFINLNT